MISIWTTGITPIVKVIEFILSKIPPVYNLLFPKEDLKIYTSERIKLEYLIGFIRFYIDVRLKNTGNTDLEFESINLSVKDPSGTAKNYIVEFPSIEGTFRFSYTLLEIRKGESWLGTICFTNDTSPSEEKKIYDIRSQVDQSVIEERKKLSPLEYSRGDLVLIDPKILDKVLKFNESKSHLEIGTYEATLKIKLKDNEKEFVEYLDFTLHDYHLDRLKKQLEDYEHVLGIATHPNPNNEVYVKINPKKRN